MPTTTTTTARQTGRHKNYQLGNRTFGVEIELKGIAGHRAAQILTAAGLTAQSEGYNHRVVRYWKCTTDASLSGTACEVVSPVLKGAEGLAELAKVLDALDADAATKVDRECGIHVHLGVSDLDLPAMKRLCKNWLRFEDSLLLLVSPSRRGGRWCKSSIERHAGGNVVERVNTGMNRVDAATDVRGLCNAMQGGDRYYAFNLAAYWRQGTVEFRCHQGSLSSEKVCNWVRLLGSLTTASAVGSRVSKRKNNGHTAVQRMKQLFMATQGGELRRYWSCRRRELERAQVRRATSPSQVAANETGHRVRCGCQQCRTVRTRVRQANAQRNAGRLATA